MTGTWVSAGTLRTRIVSAISPYVRDAIICGLNEEYVAVMLWPNPGACMELMQQTTLDFASIVESEVVRQAVREKLLDFNRANPGSSTRIARFVLLAEPPSMDGNELTEKGYINQRATLARRSTIVRQLYALAPGPDIVVL